MIPTNGNKKFMISYKQTFPLARWRIQTKVLGLKLSIRCNYRDFSIKQVRKQTVNNKRTWPVEGRRGIRGQAEELTNRVRTLFWTKTSRTLQGLSRTHFAFFKDSIQCKKEIWVYVFFSSTTTWAILSWRSFILGTWESGLDKVSTEIQGLSSTDYNFQGLSRPWTFYFKFQGLSRTFKVRANPELRTLGIM